MSVNEENTNEWKDVPGFIKIEAHQSGEIRNKKTKKVYLQESKKHRYRMLHIENTSTAFHILIAKTFCVNDNPEIKTQVNHIDGNKRNNNASNLEWISPSDNVKDAVKRGRKDGKSQAQPIRVIFDDNSSKEYSSQIEAETELNLPKLTIARYISKYNGIYYGKRGIKNKENYTPKYIFEYVKNTNSDNIEEKPVTVEGYTHLIARRDGKLYDPVTGKENVGSNDGRYKRIKSRKLNGSSTGAHRLIALTFIPNPENKPYVNHIDGNTFNNSVDNLEWVTQSENMIHSISTGLTPKKSKK